MKTMRTLMVMLLVVLPVIATHAGTFLEDFSDGNLDRWHIETAPGPPWHPVSDFLSFENGYLVINTVRNGSEAFGNSEIKHGQFGTAGFLYAGLSN